MPVNQTPADLTSSPDQRPYAGLRYILDLMLMLRAWPGQVLAVLLMMVLQLGFALLFPVALRSLFDDAVAGRDLELLLRILVAIGGGFLLSSAAGVMQDYLLSRTTARAVQALRRRIFEHLLDLSSPDIQRFGTGDLLSRFANDVAAVDAAVSRGLPLAGFNIILALSSLGLLFVIEWRLAILAAAALPFLLIGPRIFGARAARYSAIKKRAEARVLEHARVAVEGERTIRAARLRPRVLSEYRRDSDALRRAGVRVSYFGALLGRTSLLSVLLLMLLIIGLGSVLSIQGLLSTGLLLAFIGLLLNIQEAALGMAEAAPIVTAAYGGMRRAQALLATAPSVRDVALPTELAPLRDLLRVEDLSFSYEPGSPAVLCDVSLEVPRGAIVAVVGPSGSGKSTLIDLLLRLRLADSGRVLYDGRDLQLASAASLQRQMTAVFPHETLLPGTVRDNIEVGDGAGADAEDAAVAAPTTAETAARLAGVNALIGKPATAETIRDAAAHAAEGTSPPTDGNADAEYRQHLARVLTSRAVSAAVGA